MSIFGNALTYMSRGLSLAVLSVVTLSFTCVTEAAEKWDMLLYLGANAPASKIAKEFADAVAKETDNDLVIKVHAVGTLPYPASEYHRVVGRGDVAMADSAFFTADVPEVGIMTAPFLIHNYDELGQAMEIAMPDIQTHLAKYGAEVLAHWSWPTSKMFGTGNAPQTKADLAGRKFRGVSVETTELLQGLNATAVTLSSAEVATGLQYGTLNAIITSFVGIGPSGWDDLLNWNYRIEISPSPSYFLVNSKMLAALDDKTRGTLIKLAHEYSQKITNVSATLELESEARLKAKGMKQVLPTAADQASFVELSKPLWEKWGVTERQKQLMKDIRAKLNR